MYRALLVLSLVSLAAAQGSQAQQDTTGLVPGQRLRIHRQGSKKLIGILVSADSARLSLNTGPGDTTVVPRSTITSVDRSIGRKSLAGKGALYGAGFGLVGGVTVAAIACEDGLFDTESCVVGVGLVSTVLGAATGAIVGAFIHTDRWAPTAWPTLSFQPSRRDGGTVAIGMHLTF